MYLSVCSICISEGLGGLCGSSEYLDVRCLGAEVVYHGLQSYKKKKPDPVWLRLNSFLTDFEDQ